MEHITVLGALSTQLQGLQVQPPQTGTMAQYVATGIAEAEQMLRDHMNNPFVLTEGMLVAASECDRAAISSMRGVSLNLAALPCEILYQLQDGVIAELRAWEGYAIQVLNEQKIDMDQLSLQLDDLVA